MGDLGERMGAFTAEVEEEGEDIEPVDVEPEDNEDNEVLLADELSDEDPDPDALAENYTPDELAAMAVILGSRVEKRGPAGGDGKDQARDERGRFTSGPGMASAADVHHLGGGEHAIPFARASDVRAVRPARGGSRQPRPLPMAHPDDVHEVDDIPEADPADVTALDDIPTIHSGHIRLIQPPRLPSQRHSQPARRGPPGTAARLKAQDRVRRMTIAKAYDDEFRAHAKAHLDSQTYEAIHRRARATAGGKALRTGSRVISEIRFDSARYTSAQARRWLRQNGHPDAELAEDDDGHLVALTHGDLPLDDQRDIDLDDGVTGTAGRYAPRAATPEDDTDAEQEGVLDAVAKVFRKLLAPSRRVSGDAAPLQPMVQRVAKAQIEESYFDAAALVVGVDALIEDGYDPDAAEAMAAEIIAKDAESFADKRDEYALGPAELNGLDLHLASGQERVLGHIGLDLYPHDHATIIQDLTLGIPFPDASARAIYTDHALQEISDNPAGLMADIARVLMPGGRFITAGPDPVNKSAGYACGLVPLGRSDHGAEFAKVVQDDEAAIQHIIKSAGYDGPTVHVPGMSREGAAFLEAAPEPVAAIIRKAFAPERSVPIVNAPRNWRQLVYCVVLEPHTFDSQGDTMTPEEIEKAAHRYLTKSRVIGSEHGGAINAVPVESFIAPQDLVYEDGTFGSQRVAKGSWVIGIHIPDLKEWQKVLDGEYTGVSVGGFGLREDLVEKKGAADDQPRDDSGRWTSGSTSSGKSIPEKYAKKTQSAIAAQHTDWSAKDHVEAAQHYNKAGKAALANAHAAIALKKTKAAKPSKEAKEPAKEPKTKKMPPGAKPPPAPSDELQPPQIRASAINKNEKAALKDYQGIGYVTMNEHLREGQVNPLRPKTSLEYRDAARAEKQVEHLRAAIDRQVVESDTVVYRGMGGPKAAQYIKGATKPGAIIEEKGFVSTSANKETATGFSLGEPSAVFHITLTKGSKALSVEQHDPKRGMSKVEKEYILNAGTKMRVTRVERIDGDYHIHAERVD